MLAYYQTLDPTVSHRPAPETLPARIDVTVYVMETGQRFKSVLDRRVHKNCQEFMEYMGSVICVD